MPSLSRDLRRQLERIIAGENGARRIAEEGAEQSLRRLAVDAPRAHDLLTEAEKRFRVDLRRHAQQRGDRLNERPIRLIQEAAYEHWHRMLFARFLAENDLLLHPDHSVALSLDEVKELALGLKRDWIEIAAEYAQHMLLREVFRPGDPALRVPLPPEKRLELEGRLNLLPREIFLADDSLGWVYQYWQKDAKNEVNRSEVKIGADELPPVTQLFTEDYMVLFLLENTLGAWWTARRSAPDLPGYTWTYLRLTEDGYPSAGTFDQWPNSAKDLKVLDPCMGSGHFLTFALPILARMRVAEEGLSLSEAIAAVLRDNIFGLELDPRCSQIAAFNLALTAWKLAGRHFELPRLNLACSGLGINAAEEDWARLAGEDGRKQDLMRWLYSMFRHAPTLGSLIDPQCVGKPIVDNEISDLFPMLEDALSAERATDDTRELVIAAQGLVAAARVLTGQFTLIATNVPYLARGKQDDVLRKHCETFHHDARADLATCFVDRALRMCAPGGSIAVVTPQNWWFLGSYQGFRRSLLTDSQLHCVVALGEEAWQTFGDRGPVAALLIAGRLRPTQGHRFVGIDALACPAIAEKVRQIQSGEIHLLNQADQYENPDQRITTDQTAKGPLLQNFADSFQGVSPADYPHFGREFWEVSVHQKWRFWQSAVEETKPYGGRSLVLWWNQDLMSAIESGQAFIRGEKAWGKLGVACRQMRVLSCCLYTGEAFDTNTAVIVPHNPEHLPAIWLFCSSPEYALAVRRIDKTIKVTNANMVKVPFDLEHWQSVATLKCPQGIPKPHSSEPTQWLFNGHPKGSDHPLHVAVARLLGYRWPRQAGSSFPDCPPLGSDGLEMHASDGIVCLTAVAGEDGAPARLRALLQAAYGAHYNLAGLLEGKKAATLENWLRDEFFAEHCELFQQRPFVWQIWDGLKDGFHALVNYHKLDRKNLEKLIYSFLGDWLTRQRQNVVSGVEGADRRLVAAEHLQRELEKILEGEAPYDIFVRWKGIREQPIGWEPDLDDGVRMNIRPWITAARLYKATRAGILRITPNIKYTKDRGAEAAHDPKEFPWFEGSTDRINDYHLSLEEKRRARGL
jgi:hypothetical protein